MLRTIGMQRSRWVVKAFGRVYRGVFHSVRTHSCSDVSLVSCLDVRARKDCREFPREILEQFKKSGFPGPSQIQASAGQFCRRSLGRPSPARPSSFSIPRPLPL